MRTCHVVYDNDCEGGTNTECFACGRPACEGCTRMVVWHGFGLKRVCRDCLDEDDLLAQDVGELNEVL